MGSRQGKSGEMGLYQRSRPFIGVVFLQSALAGMEILSKVAMNQGMSSFVLIAYRIAVATIVMAPFAAVLERKARPKMTLPIFTKIIILSLLEPVIDQNLYYLGMKYTSATFAATMCNIIPAVTFLMAWVMGLEKVAIRSVRGQAKVFGTVVTVTGAMIMTLVKGPAIGLFSAKSHGGRHGEVATAAAGISLKNSIKGSIMIATGCISWSAFVVLQAITLKAYPAELSLTAWICMLGTVVDVILALVIERGNPSVWSITWDAKLLAVIYSGTVSSGLFYYVQGIVMRDRGPVFVTTFSPLSMVLVAIISFFLLSEQQHLGRVIGAVVIVLGLYMVVWGMSKDYKSSPLPSIESGKQEEEERKDDDDESTQQQSAVKQKEHAIARENKQNSATVV